MADLKTPGDVKLWFAVVDMEGNPGMAQVEHCEDCYDEDAYVSLADFEAQAARVKELEAERDEYRLCATQHEIGRMDFICQMWTQLDRYERDRAVLLKERDVFKARCEALQKCLRICRKCQFPAACGTCPNDAALRAAGE